MRKDKEEHCVKALERRPERRRRPGRMVEDERQTARWQSWVTVRAIATNYSEWKENVRVLCTLWHRERRR